MRKLWGLLHSGKGAGMNPKQLFQRFFRNRQRSKEKRIFLVFLMAAETILSFSSIGYLMIGKVSLTILHIPAIIATIIIGLPEGLLLAGLFGASSMYIAFTKAYNPLDLLFRDPRLALVPRLLVPVVVWICWRIVHRIADDHTLSGRLIAGAFAAICGVISHTAFVVSALAILYPADIGLMESISASTVVVSNIIALNVMGESAAAVLLTDVTLLVQEFILRKKKRETQEAAPIRKTFQKWLLLFMMLIFFSSVAFLFWLLTMQDQKNAHLLLNEKAYDIKQLVSGNRKVIPTESLKIGEKGYVLLIEKGTVSKAGRKMLEGRTLASLGVEAEKLRSQEMFFMSIDGTPGGCMIHKNGGMFVLAFLPESEIYAGRNQSASILLVVMILGFLLVYFTISNLVQKNVVKNIQDVNEVLALIRRGDLNERINVSGNAEFQELSLGINTTVDALKTTMAEITAKNHQEMEFAREVQLSALPPEGQASSGEGIYSISGSMTTAREVGGDFFDYFLVGEDKLAVMVADASGKGVPAALFMMTAKTLIKNIVLSGKSPAQVLTLANMQLCENNEKGMFVTVWLGILDYRKGILEFANAAHNPPLLKKRGEPFVFMDHRTYKRSLMLGGLEDTVYFDNRISFTAGDLLFLYTDGITEATDSDEKLYGEERLRRCLEPVSDLSPKQQIQAVYRDISVFVKDAQQFDDMTMVVLKMTGELEKHGSQKSDGTRKNS